MRRCLEARPYNPTEPLTAVPLSTGTRLGAYEIVRLIAAGGMGEVYRARDLRLGRIVAIKVLPEESASDPDRRQRFEREARAVAALNHPHICNLYDVGEVAGPGIGISDFESIRFLVMEHIDAQTLADRAPDDPRRRAR